MGSIQARTLRVFVCYAHEDQRWLHGESLIPSLAASLRKDNVAFWYDARLVAGDRYRQVIETEIARADIAILLVSQYFLDSTFINEVELPAIQSRAASNQMVILPVLVSPCTWEESPLLRERTMLPAKLTPLIYLDGHQARYEHARDEILRALKTRVRAIQADGRLSHATAAGATPVPAGPATLAGREQSELPQRRWLLIGGALLAIGLLAGMTLGARQLERATVDPKQASATAPTESESDYRMLFNGQDLDGWFGETELYRVDNGTLICDSWGEIWTTQEFDDFSLRFEFRLSSGADSGVAIRSPAARGSAYVGMEIQILDDVSPWDEAMPTFGFHGSIYGVAKAKGGHLKPIGEWNRQEIIAIGRRITVVLNGATVVDVDLDEILRHGTPDRVSHPGLRRTSGHIGIVGMRPTVEFRNVRIKELNR